LTEKFLHGANYIDYSSDVHAPLGTRLFVHKTGNGPHKACIKQATTKFSSQLSICAAQFAGALERFLAEGMKNGKEEL
jgi:hypothetical protein